MLLDKIARNNLLKTNKLILNPNKLKFLANFQSKEEVQFSNKKLIKC